MKNNFRVCLFLVTGVMLVEISRRYYIVPVGYDIGIVGIFHIFDGIDREVS